MPHGHKDWANRRGSGPTFALSDMAELAARLGSPLAYYRSGDTVFIETFAGGMTTWDSTPYGEGSAITLTADTALSAPYSAYLVAGAVEGGAALVQRSSAPISTGKLGFYVAFALGLYLNRIFWRIYTFDADKERNYDIYYCLSDGQLAYRNAKGGYTEIAMGIGLAQDARVFHHAKLVIDRDTHCYDRFYLDDMLYDLEGIAPNDNGGGKNPHMVAQVYIKSDESHECVVWVDNLALTMNEP